MISEIESISVDFGSQMLIVDCLPAVIYNSVQFVTVLGQWRILEIGRFILIVI